MKIWDIMRASWRLWRAWKKAEKAQKKGEPIMPNTLDAAKTGTGIWGIISALCGLGLIVSKVFTGQQQLDQATILEIVGILSLLLTVLRARLAGLKIQAAAK